MKKFPQCPSELRIPAACSDHFFVDNSLNMHFSEKEGRLPFCCEKRKFRVLRVYKLASAGHGGRNVSPLSRSSLSLTSQEDFCSSRKWSIRHPSGRSNYPCSA